MVNWVEKASLDRISQLLKIIKREHNHKLFLSAKNLQELGASPFPYIIFVLPRSLPVELVKGKHFVLANLLKLIPRSSSQVDSSPKPLFVRVSYPRPRKILSSPPRRRRRKRRRRRRPGG